MAWVGYSSTSEGWSWRDGSTDVDTNILDMEDFNNQNDSIGACSVVKEENGVFKLLKEDCDAKHLVYCIAKAV